MALTPNQIKEYYASESSKAAPLSPLAWQELQKPPVAEKVSPVTMISSPAGVDKVKETQKELFSITPQPTEIKEQPKKEVKPVNFINPATGQTQSITDETSMMNALDQGWVTGENQTEFPSFLMEPLNKEKMEMRRREVQNDKEYNDTIKKLDQFAVSDSSLQAQIDTIKQQYATRIEDMKEINRRRASAVSTLGYRMGIQYTGGMGGPFGGVIAEEERQSQRRIGELTADMNTEIQKAQEAARTKNWNVFVAATDLAKEKRAERTKELENYNKLLVEENKRIATEKADLIKAEVETKKGINEIMLEAGKNDAPQEVQDAIAQATNYSEAIEAARGYLKSTQNLPAEIQQYEYDRAQREAMGLSPRTYDEWQTIDANRKALANRVTDSSGLTPKQQTILNQIINNYNKSVMVAAADRAITLKNSIKNAKKNPEDGTVQLSLIYGYIQALDQYQSAVREGEIGLTQSLLGLRGKLDTWASQLEKTARPLSSDVALKIATNAEQLVETIDSGAKKAEEKFRSQARVNNLLPAWDDFRGAFQTSYDLNKGESDMELEAKSRITAFYSLSEGNKKQIIDAVEVFKQEMGREPTYAELITVFPEI